MKFNPNDPDNLPERFLSSAWRTNEDGGRNAGR
jgi:hypothetical protein